MLITVEQANRDDIVITDVISKLWLHLIAQAQVGAILFGWL